MHYRTRDKKARAEEFEMEFDEAMIEKFLDEVEDEFGKDHYAIEASKEYLDGMEAEDINSDFAEEIAAGLTDEDQDIFIGLVQSFTMPDVGEWCFDQVENELSDIGDQQRDLERERDWDNQ